MPDPEPPAAAGVTVPADEAELPPELADLGKELQCPICLSTLQAPTARLPCCHYFCLGCLTESLQHKPACPTCKLFSRKRDVTRDYKIDKIAGLFAQLEAAAGSLIFVKTPAALARPPAAQRHQGVVTANRTTPSNGAAVFHVPSPPQSPQDFHTAPEETLELEEDRGVAFSLWKNTPPMTQMTQFSRGGTQHSGPVQHPMSGQLPVGPSLADEMAQAAEIQAGNASLNKDAQQGSTDIAATALAAGEAKSKGRKRKPLSNLTNAALPTKRAGTDKRRSAKAKKDSNETAAGPAPKADDFRAPKPTACTRRGRKSAAPEPATPAAWDGAASLPLGSQCAATVRRVPSRLQPWSCQMCTLENIGTARKCAICNTPKANIPQSAQSGALRGALDTSLQQPGMRPLDAQKLAPHEGPKAVEPLVLEGEFIRQSTAREVPRKAQAKKPRVRKPSDSAGRKKAKVLPGPNKAEPIKDQDSSDPQAIEEAYADPEIQVAKGTKKRAPKAKTAKPPKAQQAAAPEAPDPLPKCAPSGCTDSAPAQDIRKWQTSMKGSWVLLGSGLTDEMDKENLQALAKASGARIATEWDASVTHVVCGVDSSRTAKRTIKFMLGVLEGVWIVGGSWMTACLLSEGPEGEDSHEVAGCSNIAGGPVAGRARRRLAQKKLLEGIDIVLQGSLKSKREIASLVNAAGGHILPRVPPEAPQGAGLVVVSDSQPKTDSDKKGRAGRSAHQSVSLSWLMDSVSAHSLKPLDQYYV